jgi:hypothetical protein
MTFQSLYGLLPVLTEPLLIQLQEEYRNLTDEELLTMICPTETVQ